MVLENRITFAQHLLITQEELKNRWQHATTNITTYLKVVSFRPFLMLKGLLME